MEKIIFFEKALLVFAETLWVVYLVSAVFLKTTKFVFSMKALKNFKRLKFSHRWVFMPILLIFTFYELEMGGSLNKDLQLLLIILIVVNMVSFGVLKMAVCYCIKSLIGKTVNLIICYADDEVVEYSIFYKKKVLTRDCCSRKYWGSVKIESGDILIAVISESHSGSEKIFDVKLIE